MQGIALANGRRQRQEAGPVPPEGGPASPVLARDVRLRAADTWVPTFEVIDREGLGAVTSLTCGDQYPGSTSQNPISRMPFVGSIGKILRSSFLPPGRFERDPVSRPPVSKPDTRIAVRRTKTNADGPSCVRKFASHRRRFALKAYRFDMNRLGFALKASGFDVNRRRSYRRHGASM